MKLSFSLLSTAMMLASMSIDNANAFSVPRTATRSQTVSSTTSLKDSDASVDVGLGKVTLNYTPDPTPAPPPEVIKGIHLPEGKIPPKIENEFVDTVIKGFATKLLFNLNGYLMPVTLPKKSLSLVQGIMAHSNLYEFAMNEAYDKIAEELHLDRKLLPNAEDYKFFGNGNYRKTLSELIKTNPFWTSTIIKNERGGYDLISYDPKNPDLDPKKMKSRYQSMVSTLTNPGRRVNVHFNDKMKVESVEVFDDIYGNSIKKIGGIELRTKEGKDLADYWISSAMYNCIFYVSCQHAMIHVLHYLMTSAFQYVAAESGLEGMQGWADTYANNIQGKYEQVGTLLITDAAPIPATIPGTNNDPKVVGAVVAFTYSLLTGPLGFGSNQLIRPQLKEMLNEWGTNPSAKGWIKQMMNFDITENGIFLTEFQKQCNLIDGFAAEGSTVLTARDKDGTVQAELVTYLKECGGFESKIDSFEDWLQLMSVTGIVHGSTLSYTRAISDEGVLRWRNIKNPAWDTGDMNLLFSGLGTICGMQEGRHVMGGGEFLPEGEESDIYRNVIKKWDDKALKLKMAYTMEIIEKPDFNNYGWIWSDFCPDGFDGKQLTMATYI